MTTESTDTHGLIEDWEYSPRQVKGMLQNPESGILLVDCRTEEEWDKARIEGAMLIPLQEMPERAHELEPYSDRDIVIYCHHGRRSMRAASILRNAGIGHAMSMAGGIERWSDDVDPSVPKYTK